MTAPRVEVNVMGKASTKAQNKYILKAYDRINLTVPKGRKEDLQAHAEAHSESVNGFINRAIEEAVERESAAPGAAVGPAEATHPVGLVPPGKVEVVKAHLELTGESEEEFLERTIETGLDRDRRSFMMGINPRTGETLKRGS